ncbi:Myosin-Ic, partial [Ophiophagus hannah]
MDVGGLWSQIQQKRSLIPSGYHLFHHETYIGSVLVSVNPYKDLEIYSKQHMNRYRGVSFYEVSPHLWVPEQAYAIADNAYRSLRTERKDQCILISGESGAGKTEATKKILQYYAVTCPASEQVETVKDRLLQSNPVLEAFGNAKTLRNDNSSRFGKYMDVQFDYKGAPIGGHILNYLLEKSRVVHQNHGERNFHIFYQLLEGGEEDLLRRLGLEKSPHQYQFLVKGQCAKVASINDKSDWKVVRRALSVINFSDSEVEDLLSIIASVLHLGNVQFTTDEHGSAQVTTENQIKYLARLLGLENLVLQEALTHKKIIAKGEQVPRVLVLIARAQRGDWWYLFFFFPAADQPSQPGTGLLRSRRFGQSRVRAHLLLAGGQDKQILGLQGDRDPGVEEKLDSSGTAGYLRIRGFPAQQVRFQAPWASPLARNPLAAGLAAHPRRCLTRRGCSQTLSPCSLVALQSPQPPAAELHFGGSLSEDLVLHEGFEQFCINYCNEKLQQLFIELTLKSEQEEYEAEGIAWEPVQYFNNKIICDLVEEKFKGIISILAMCDSENPIITQCFDRMELTGKKRPETAVTQFKNSLLKLMEILMSKEPSYVRCIKPNHAKQAGNFDEVLIRHQVKYLGLMENLRVRRAGFAYRRKYEVFLQRYKSLCPETWPTWNGKPQEGVAALLKHLGFKQEEYKLGRTKIFIRFPKTLFATEEALEVRKQSLATKIQAAWRGFYRRKKYLQMKHSAVTIQAWWRGTLGRRKAAKKKWAVEIIRRFIKGFIYRNCSRCPENEYFLDYIRYSFLMNLKRNLPKTVLEKSWPVPPPSLREASQLLRGLCMQNMVWSYCKRISPEWKAQGKKDNYPQSVPRLFLNTRLGNEEINAKILQVLGNEALKYAVPVIKYDRKGYKARARQLLLTQNAAVLVEESKVKQQIDYGNLTGISVSSLSDNLFVLHVLRQDNKQKGDVVLQSDFVIETLTKIAVSANKVNSVNINQGREEPSPDPGPPSSRLGAEAWAWIALALGLPGRLLLGSLDQLPLGSKEDRGGSKLKLSSLIKFTVGQGREGIIDFTSGSELLIAKAKNGHLAVVAPRLNSR